MRFVTGVDIGGTDIKIGLVTFDGRVEKSGTIPTRSEEGPGAAAARVREWLKGQGAEVGETSVAGVACAGLIDRETGSIITSPNLDGWDGAELGRIFSAALALPVHVENDANAAAFGEYRMGAGRGTKDFACLTLGTGVGGGFVTGGGLHRGFHGLAGEIGHTIIMEGGPQCSCGNRGCLEAFVGAGYIVERARAALESEEESELHRLTQITVKDISIAASKGDKLSLNVLKETGRYLGIGLCNLIHVMDPEVIAIGGGVAGAGELILGPARAAIRDCVMHEVLAGVRIVQAELGNSAAMIGVSILAGIESGAI
jgi:glucokinase